MAKNIVGPLFFALTGNSGTPMVFLHSTPDDHRLWMYQTAHFSTWYRTIAIDMAGYGHSPTVKSGVSLDDHAAACWEAVDRAVGPGAGIILHGNSMGGMVSTVMARQQPQRLLALIISGHGQSAGNANFLEWMKRYAANGIGYRDYQLADHMLPATRETPIFKLYAEMVQELNNEGTLESIIANNEALSHKPTDEYVAQITAPTLIMRGAQDRSPDTGARHLHALIKGSDYVAIDNAAHACNFEQPAVYNANTIAFLSKLGLHPKPGS